MSAESRRGNAAEICRGPAARKIDELNKMIKFKRRACVFATRDKILKFSEPELKTRAEAKRSKTATKKILKGL